MNYKVNRRRLLRNTTASSVALFATLPSSALSAENTSTVDFVECGIEHELTSGKEDYRRLVLDSPPTYYHVADNIVVNEHLDSDGRQRLKTQDVVVSFDGIHGTPAKSLRKQPDHHLATELRGDLESGRAVQVEEPYAPPPFTVQTSPSGVTVTTPDREQSVAPDSEVTLELPAKSVSIVSYERTNPQVIEQPPEGRETVYDYEKKATKVTVKPQLHVQYHSEQTVIGASDQMEDF